MQQIPFGNGFGCIGGSSTGVFRLLPVEFTSPEGSSSRLVDFSEYPACSGPGQITPGSTRHFQHWRRYPDGGGQKFNLSDALRVTFCP